LITVCSVAAGLAERGCGAETDVTHSNRMMGAGASGVDRVAG
jgi:hypothetical protein